MDGLLSSLSISIGMNRLLLFIAFSFYIFCVVDSNAQVGKVQGKIKILNADSLNFDKQNFGDGVQVLLGHVKFSHENVIMYCDEAYMYRDSNVVVAKHNIHIIQNDTLHLYGDNLNYDGNIGLAKVRDNVKMVNKEVVLTTQFLDYDRFKGVGYYFNGGTIINKEDTLKSNWGYYYTATNEVQFKDSVSVKAPKYTLLSDTLKYHTITEVISIVGPTNILSNENRIYSEFGYYDSKSNYARLLKNSTIFGKTSNLSGDTIYYNRLSGYGEVFSNMAIADTSNTFIIRGDYGFYNELTKCGLATKNAELHQIQKGDTLFLHADTLTLNSNLIDSTNTIHAFHNVKFFREDMQGRCDSMVYTSVDSINTLYHDPVVWAMGNQLTAEKIRLYAKNGKFDRIQMENLAFAISREDSIKYNQISGQLMTGFIRNNKLYKIDVDGNGQSIYYPKDKEALIGVNKAVCSAMTIYLGDQTIERIIMRTNPIGTLNPPIVLKPSDYQLTGFYWLEEFRPKSKIDIYIKNVLPERVKGEDISSFQLDDSFSTDTVE